MVECLPRLSKAMGLIPTQDKKKFLPILFLHVCFLTQTSCIRTLNKDLCGGLAGGGGGWGRDNKESKSGFRKGTRADDSANSLRAELLSYCSNGEQKTSHTKASDSRVTGSSCYLKFAFSKVHSGMATVSGC